MHVRHAKRAVAAVATCAAALAAALPALASSRHSVITESVGARLTNIGKPAKTRLIIRLNGSVVYNQLVRSGSCGSLCTETAIPPGKASLRVLDIESDGRPDVLLGLYSGGAHCCFADQVFSQVPGTTRYVKTEHNFLDAGARLQKLGRRWVFMSADARIADEYFTDFAHSGMPIQIWQFSNRRFIDITRHYPRLIAPDAARWWTAFKRNRTNNAGMIAAWAADEDLLGHYSQVRSTLNAEAAKGALTSSLGLPHSSQTAFVAELQQDLRKLGYTK
ncbi:MAG: hypothetical protein ACYCXW_04000 [Solirubrobacteraceae bacterium]